MDDDAVHACEFDGAAADLVTVGGDVYVGGTLALQAADKPSPAGMGEILRLCKYRSFRFLR